MINIIKILHRRNTVPHTYINSIKYFINMNNPTNTNILS